MAFMTSGELKKWLSWRFSRRKAEIQFSLCSDFQSLAVIENGEASLPRSGISIFRDALMQEFR